MEWIIQVPILFFSIVIHEFAHGFVAYKRGDDTAYLSGRLTFNPIPHIDPVGTIILPFMSIMSNIPMIGWAKPVPINPMRFYDYRKDLARVAISGPGTNFALAIISLILYKLVLIFPATALGLSFAFLKACKFAFFINLALGLFNLIPVFPLDGSQILLGLLPHKYLDIYEKHIPFGIYIILFLVITGIIKYIIFFPMILILNLLAQFGLILTL
jgi:Zn-dependent protease